MQRFLSRGDQILTIICLCETSCQYLATKLLDAPITSLFVDCVCLCDDDNDLEMALACQHAFIPGISSESMAKIIANNPDHFSQTGGSKHEGIEGTIATEKALSLALKRIERKPE